MFLEPIMVFVFILAKMLSTSSLVRGSTIRSEVFGTFRFFNRWSSENPALGNQAKNARMARTLLETVWDEVLPLTPGRSCRCKMYSLTSISEISPSAVERPSSSNQRMKRASTSLYHLTVAGDLPSVRLCISNMCTRRGSGILVPVKSSSDDASLSLMLATCLLAREVSVRQASGRTAGRGEKAGGRLSGHPVLMARITG